MIFVTDAHTTFGALHSAEQERMLLDLRQAGVRIVYDQPPTNPETLERQAGLGRYAFELAAWPSRAYLVSPSGIVLRESILSSSQIFSVSELRQWLGAVNIRVGLDFYAARLYSRAQSRLEYWFGSSQPDSCPNDCLVAKK